MRLLLYTPFGQSVGEQLYKMLGALVSENDVEVYRTIEGLSRRLRQPGNDLPFAILHAPRREDLKDILAIRDLLRDIRIILVLPDRDENTIAQGHILRPRFLCYTDSDLADVSAVLKKCLTRYAAKI
jgi:hypothetical protein